MASVYAGLLPDVARNRPQQIGLMEGYQDPGVYAGGLKLMANPSSFLRDASHFANQILDRAERIKQREIEAKQHSDKMGLERDKITSSERITSRQSASAENVAKINAEAVYNKKQAELRHAEALRLKDQEAYQKLVEKRNEFQLKFDQQARAFDQQENKYQSDAQIRKIQEAYKNELLKMDKKIEVKNLELQGEAQKIDLMQQEIKFLEKQLRVASRPGKGGAGRYSGGLPNVENGVFNKVFKHLKEHDANFQSLLHSGEVNPSMVEVAGYLASQVPANSRIYDIDIFDEFRRYGQRAGLWNKNWQPTPENTGLDQETSFGDAVSHSLKNLFGGNRQGDTNTSSYYNPQNGFNIAGGNRPTERGGEAPFVLNSPISPTSEEKTGIQPDFDKFEISNGKNSTQPRVFSMKEMGAQPVIVDLGDGLSYDLTKLPEPAVKGIIENIKTMESKGDDPKAMLRVVLPQLEQTFALQRKSEIGLHNTP